jgi:hypothetical protein
MTTKDQSFASLLWSEDINNEHDDALVAAQKSHTTAVSLDRIETFRDLLLEVFPKGDPEEKHNAGPTTIAMRVGDHWVGIVGAVKPRESEVTWAGFWRQNVMGSLGQQWQNSAKRHRAQRGATIEKATKVFRSDQGLIGWLSWVHRNICKVSAETIRAALHPDNFMQDASAAFRAAYDLSLIAVALDDVDDLITQRLPWRSGGTNLGSLCTVLRDGQEMGRLGVKQKGGYWKYGGKLDLAKVNAAFHMTKWQDWKFKRQAAVAICGDLDAAVLRAERYYARKMFEFLLDQGQQEGLRQA